MTQTLHNPDLRTLLERLTAVLQAGDNEAIADCAAGAHAADLAEVFPLLSEQDQSRLFFSLPARSAAELMIELDEAERADVVEDLDETRLTGIVTELAPDDAADVLGELTDEQREGVLEQIPEEHSEKIENLLGHHEESAGGIMTPELVALPHVATVAQAVEAVRQASEDEEIHYVYVVDDEKRLFGLVPLRRLVTQKIDTKLADICIRDPVVVKVGDDQERVAQRIRKYDVSAVPVVDDRGRLVGRITHDDILDVAEEEADEDIYYMAGTDAAELEESPLKAALIRFRWLTACMFGTTVSGLLILLSDRAFPHIIINALIPFVPMMGAMGGNSGIQISTIIVRGLATGEFAATMLKKSMARELRIVLFMAPLCGILAGIIAMIGSSIMHESERFQGVESPAHLSLAVGLGMVAAIFFASLLGMLLPHMFRRIGVDPAIASGPVVTTANDIVSVSAYLSIAYVVMM